MLLTVVRDKPLEGYDVLKTFGSLCYATLIANHDRFSSDEFKHTLCEGLEKMISSRKLQQLLDLLDECTVAELGELPALDKVSLPFVSMDQGIKKMVMKDSTPVTFDPTLIDTTRNSAVEDYCLRYRSRYRFWPAVELGPAAHPHFGRAFKFNLSLQDPKVLELGGEEPTTV